MSQPSLAIICNSVPPYRVHVHRRIARELPWLKLWTVCTHDGMFNPWEHNPPAEINPVDFGRRGDGGRQGLSVSSFFKGGRIIRWLRDQRINAVLVMGYNDPARLRIFRWCAAHDVPCFVWGDSNIKSDFAAGMRLRVKRIVVGWVMRQVSAVLTCGSLGEAYFRRYGAKPEQIFWFPNEPDYSVIEQVDSATVASTLQQLGLDPRRRRIVFSGRFVVEKRIEILIDAFAAIAAARPEWDLIIIGDGPRRGELEAKAPEHLRSRIIWLGFVESTNVVMSIYRGSDVMALASDYEPWGLVINEATAAGMAIVCTDVVGAGAELVSDGVNGFRVPAKLMQAFANALLKVTDPSRIDEYKQASKSILAGWRERADPVDGMRRALRHVGINGLSA